jgi:hypothetical protein
MVKDKTINDFECNRMLKYNIIHALDFGGCDYTSILLKYLEQSSSSEADSRTVSEEIALLLWKLKFH